MPHTRPRGRRGRTSAARYAARRTEGDRWPGRVTGISKDTAARARASHETTWPGSLPSYIADQQIRKETGLIPAAAAGIQPVASSLTATTRVTAARALVRRCAPAAAAGADRRDVQDLRHAIAAIAGETVPDAIGGYLRASVADHPTRTPWVRKHQGPSVPPEPSSAPPDGTRYRLLVNDHERTNLWLTTQTRRMDTQARSRLAVAAGAPKTIKVGTWRHGTVSPESPMGTALLRAIRGTKFEINGTPYRVLAITPPRKLRTHGGYA